MTAAPPQIEDVLALSPLQEGLFSLSRLTGDGIDLYTMQFVVDIDGPVNLELLRRSAQAMLDRHPNLKAAFWDKDVPRPVQIVPKQAELPWTEKDATPAEFDAIAESERRRPFDLGRGPALRILILHVPGSDTRRLILTAHHILMDGWAVAVFFTELLAVYQAGGATAILPPVRKYREYIAWLAGQDRAAALTKWAAYLGDLTGPMVLADGAAIRPGAVPEKTKLVLPAAETERLQQWSRANGLTLNTAVQFAWTVVLGRLTDRRDVVYGTTVSGRPEGLPGVEGMVGLFINTVPVTHHLDRGVSVVDQCTRLQRDCAAMRDIGYLSLSEVQRATGHGSLFDTLFVFENAPIDDAIQEVTAPDGARFRPIEMESLAHYPLTVVSHLSDGDLIVLVEAIREALPYISASALAERLVEVLRRLPDAGGAGPDQLDVLTKAERAELGAAVDHASADHPAADALDIASAVTPETAVAGTSAAGTTVAEELSRPAAAGDTDEGTVAPLVAFGADAGAVREPLAPVAGAAVRGRAERTGVEPGTRFETAERSVWESFERQAAATPDAVALQTSAGERYTYAELRDAAARLAGELASHGVGPETVVALVMPRSTQSIIGLLAAFAAGAAYVPVDITLPVARIESILRQARPALLLTVTESHELVAGESTAALVLDDPAVAERISRRTAIAPEVVRHPDQCAYLIFTSGSTGEPKGVAGTNAAVLAYFADHRDRVYRPAMERLGRPLRIAHAWSLSFDASWQPMVGFLAGQTLHLFDAEEMRDAHRLVAGMTGHGIDMIDTTPSMFAQLNAAGLVDGELPVLALGGEAIDAALWARLRALSTKGTGTAVYNCYGPTETTVEAVVAPVGAFDTPTIGTPNAGMSGYILDSMLRPVPHGVVGELYLSGPQLARGYIGRPATTSDRFVADPFRPGRRMYRTGDLVRRLPHRGIGYLGRADAQVKVRGYRIEIGEIETALRQLPGVDTAAVTVVRRAGGASLVGFLVGEAGRTLDPARLRLALADRLPSYMIPARLLVRPQLPVNSNGKLDGHELLRQAEEALAGSGSGAAPSTATEKELGAVLAELFDGRTPGLDDDFFALGVDSIVAISLVNKARRRGLALTPRMVLSAPTIRELAAALDAAPVAAQSDDAAYGEILPLPVVSWMYEYGSYRRFTQTALLRLPAGIQLSQLESALQSVVDGYATLRSRLIDTADGPRLVTEPAGSIRAADLITTIAADSGTDLDTIVHRAARAANDEIDPRTGDMVRAIWFTGTSTNVGTGVGEGTSTNVGTGVGEGTSTNVGTGVGEGTSTNVGTGVGVGEGTGTREGSGEGEVLLLTIHHLAVDVVSWHLLLAAFTEAWTRIASGAEPSALPEATSYREWSRRIWDRAAEPEVLAQRDYWTAQLSAPDPAVGQRVPDPRTDTWSSLRVASAVTPVDVTARMLAALTREEGVREFLLTALAMTIAALRKERDQDPAAGALIALEGHGRADDLLDTDTTNTLGWFTSVFPVRLGAGDRCVDIEAAQANPAAAHALLESVTTHVSTIPNQGLDYGLLRYITRTPELVAAPEPQIEFNYLGRVDLSGQTPDSVSLLTGPLNDALPLDPEPDLPLRYALDVIAGIGTTPDGPQLTTNWRWSTALFTESEATRLTELWQQALATLAAAL
ncbi:amino acid adenylation domain-containing protein [Nocardia yamanashiensis]|uniref:non-ribosomal peptide synthetase n=1 Tax=Nocardia yamanashiensis TaxID=209247 RepID=UPI001E3EC2AB|nr:non-ribosomal peptide synthetase [Nocardia yamanashiensis]UGT39737.1 amino acid adenylation domain-containing protein [Nocardia yamanashiensis]